MEHADAAQLFTPQFLEELLPETVSNDFFEALYGDADEGAYNIKLEFISAKDSRLVLAFNLEQRPGKCLVCSLTYGLPNVFSRHPRININGMVKKIEDKGLKVKSWQLGQTEENSSALHVIPLFIDLE